MGNLAPTPFRASAPAPALPSDAVVIDCDWLEATHPHFQHARTYEQQYEPATIRASAPRKTERSSWMCDVLRSCRQTLRAFVSKPTAAPVAVCANIDADEASAGATDDSFFDEFHQVFTPRSALKKTVPTFVAPANATVKTVGGWNTAAFVKTKALAHTNDEGDDDDDDDFEDCLSYTTDATDSLSESECESKCFAFCGGLECESQSCCDIEPQDDGTDTDSIYSDDNNTEETDDEDEDDEDCLARAERLVRMASTCADFSVYLDDYLCECGECPQYKLIAYEVQRYGTYANDAEMASLTRILQAFSTYNEVVGYDCDMIPTAEECLQVWNGDEDQAFKSFVTLYDEVPHLCA